ncbi:MAG TPA: aldo/keto reductase [Candidatus Acidoferrales bacterium]|nr:aldo/keto reductase [Candidatus Acidoferrales bacterium]
MNFEKRKLGRNGPEVTTLGLGCYSFSSGYGEAAEAESLATIERAIALGCNFLDTADMYGAGHNERLVGRAIAKRREQIVLATKGGFVWDAQGKVTGRNGRPEHIRAACEASLDRLGTDYIDLYYLHRVDPSVPVEDSVGAIAELAAEGKVRHAGLSEATADEIRRAHAVHPIAAVQSEYSLWTRGPEGEALPACEELGIGFVAFCPLGRGFFTGKLKTEELGQGDARRTMPRFEGDNLSRNLKLLEVLEGIAREKNCTPAQLALAWVLGRGKNVTAIPGTRRVAHLEENFAAMEHRLSAAEVRRIDEAVPPDAFAGERYAAASVFKPRA